MGIGSFQVEIVCLGRLLTQAACELIQCLGPVTLFLIRQKANLSLLDDNPYLRAQSGVSQ